MQAIVPIKRFNDAKQRLSAIASPSARASIAEIMATHVLTELARAHALSGVLVVSSEPSIRSLVRRLGFDFLFHDDGGLNGALTSATNRLPIAQAADIVIVHADLPLFAALEFDSLCRQHAEGSDRKMTIVPDVHSSGTNVRFCRPGLAVKPLYGRGSMSLHLQEARGSNLAVDVVTSPSLSMDCDTIDDFETICNRAGRVSQLLKNVLPAHVPKTAMWPGRVLGHDH